MSNYLYENNYKHITIDGIEYVLIWNVLRFPYIPNMGISDIDEKFTPEQITVIDRMICEFPLKREYFYDEGKKDCVDVDKLKIQFELMDVNKKMRFLEKMVDFGMPGKYTIILKEELLKEISKEYKLRKKMVFDLFNESL
jgi:hypothetical protein